MRWPTIGVLGTSFLCLLQGCVDTSGQQTQPTTTQEPTAQTRRAVSGSVDYLRTVGELRVDISYLGDLTYSERICFERPQAQVISGQHASSLLREAGYTAEYGPSFGGLFALLDASNAIAVLIPNWLPYKAGFDNVLFVPFPHSAGIPLGLDLSKRGFHVNLSAGPLSGRACQPCEGCSGRDSESCSCGCFSGCAPCGSATCHNCLVSGPSPLESVVEACRSSARFKDDFPVAKLEPGLFL
jgi:hypothetical protein